MAYIRKGTIENPSSVGPTGDGKATKLSSEKSGGYHTVPFLLTRSEINLLSRLVKKVLIPTGFCGSLALAVTCRRNGKRRSFLKMNWIIIPTHQFTNVDE